MARMVAADVKEAVLDDSGHFVPEERPDALVSAIIALHERITRTGLKKGRVAMKLIPDDNLSRHLAFKSEQDNLPHLGVVGDTYTIVLTGDETAGRFCLIDFHIPPGGGPPPHRHDFEETFILLEGEIQVTFRGEKRVVKAGETINIPANAPHQFHNGSSAPARMFCICSPAGQEELFREVGIPVATRITPPPKLSDEQQAAFMKKVLKLAPKYRTEILREVK
jgi:quercetin dioxygenase-like cupin family protein